MAQVALCRLMGRLVELYSIHGTCPYAITTTRAPLRDYQDRPGLLVPREGAFWTGSPTRWVLTLFADVRLGPKAHGFQRHLNVREPWDVGLEFGHRTCELTGPAACAEIIIRNYGFPHLRSFFFMAQPSEGRAHGYMFLYDCLKARCHRLRPYTSHVSSSCRIPRTPAACHPIPVM